MVALVCQICNSSSSRSHSNHVADCGGTTLFCNQSLTRYHNVWLRTIQISINRSKLGKNVYLDSKTRGIWSEKNVPHCTDSYSGSTLEIPEGTFRVGFMQEEDISATSVVLTRAFASSPQAIPIDQCRYEGIIKAVLFLY